MTKNYSIQMWKRYLSSLLHSPEKRIIENPAVSFRKKVIQGDYDKMPDNKFQILLDDYSEESERYFDKNEKASGLITFIRAFQNMNLTQDDINKLSEILAEAGCRSQQMDNELPFI